MRLLTAKYSSIDELLKSFLTATFQVFKNNNVSWQTVQITRNKITNQINYQIANGVQIRILPEFAEVLGFDPNQILKGKGEALYSYDVKRGLNSIYVYCNVVDTQIVGDVYAPLLRTVAVKGEQGDVISEIFDRPHYVNVNTDEVSMLEINIKDDTGKDISFNFGKVLCKLHFRQKSI